MPRAEQRFESGERSVWSLVATGTLFLARALRGRAPALGVTRRDFARHLLRAMRLHFFAFPAAAALAGAAAVPGQGISLRLGVAVAAVALAWGVGQLLNDALDVEADAVDAPDRPFVSGLLPEAPTAAVGLALGLLVTLALASVHPQGIVLVATSACLLFTYGRAKAIVGLGNVAHGLLMAVIALTGAAAVAPERSLIELASTTWRTTLAVLAIAALYLQANYEKDRVGDRAAGYRTLALLLGVRGSAALRAGLGIAIALTAYRVGLLPNETALVCMALSLSMLGISVGLALAAGSERGALGGYRFAMHSTASALLALAAPRLGSAASLAMLAAAALLTERAFRLVKNP